MSRKALILLTLFLVFTSYSFACSCDSRNLEWDISDSDFIGQIKILKNYKTVNNQDYYRVDVLVKDIYKGYSVKSIYVYGYNQSIFKSSCDLLIPENTELIIFAKNNKKGELEISMCSRLIYLNATNTNSNKIIKVLEVFREEKLFYKSIINKNYTLDFQNFLSKQNPTNVINNVAIYEVTFKDNFKVKCVKTISGFNNKIDRKIKRRLNQSIWGVESRFKDVPIKDFNKHFIIIYNDNHRLYK